MWRKVAIAVVILLVAYVAWGVISAIIGLPGPNLYFFRPKEEVADTDPISKLRQTPVIVEHSVLNGVHTYKGSVIVPVCQELGAGLRATGSDPARVRVQLFFSQTADCGDSGEAQKIFSVTYTPAGKDTKAPVFDGLAINGVSTEVNLVEK